MTPETYHKGGALLRQIETTKQAIRYWAVELKSPRTFLRLCDEANNSDADEWQMFHRLPEIAVPTDEEFAALKSCVLNRLRGELGRLEAEFSEL